MDNQICLWASDKYCNPFKGSSHVKLPSESMNSTKGLINIKNNDNCNASVVNIYSTNTKLTI